MDLGTVAYELYGLPPGQFVAARDARVAEAKGAGDRELAEAVKQLRRPTTGAWLANLLVRERRDQVTELLDLGNEMRRAQKDLAGDDLRRLSQRRRRLVSALAEEAGVVGAEHGYQMNDSSLHDVEATLEAAIADGAAGEAMLTGCLTVALSYSGFGSVDLAGVVAAPTASRPAASPRPKRTSPVPGKKAPVPGKKDRPVADPRRQKRIEDAEELLAVSKAMVLAADEAMAEADDQLSTAQHERTRLEGRMSDLEEELRALRSDLERAKRDERGALKARDLADRDLRKLQDRLARVTADLESLRSSGA